MALELLSEVVVMIVFGDVCEESFVLFCEDPRQHLGERICICYVVELLALISDVVSLRKNSHPM